MARIFCNGDSLSTSIENGLANIQSAISGASASATSAISAAGTSLKNSILSALPSSPGGTSFKEELAKLIADIKSGLIGEEEGKSAFSKKWGGAVADINGLLKKVMSADFSLCDKDVPDVDGELQEDGTYAKIERSPEPVKNPTPFVPDKPQKSTITKAEADDLFKLETPEMVILAQNEKLKSLPGKTMTKSELAEFSQNLETSFHKCLDKLEADSDTLRGELQALEESKELLEVKNSPKFQESYINLEEYFSINGTKNEKTATWYTKHLKLDELRRIRLVFISSMKLDFIKYTIGILAWKAPATALVGFYEGKAVVRYIDSKGVVINNEDYVGFVKVAWGAIQGVDKASLITYYRQKINK